MRKPIQRYEYGHLLIGEEGFTKGHWEAFVKLNTVHEGKYFEVLHNGLRFKQYVGVIQVDDILVEILPKADKDEDDNPKWQGVLLSMLQACGQLKADSHDSANVSRQNLNLLEVYFEIYLRELEKLQRLGLIKQYRKNTGNVKALKGKLEFSGNIRHNLVHKERFYTTHQVYDVDHQLHQVLNTALSIVSRFTKGTRLSNLCNRIEMSFPEVSKLMVTPTLLDKLKLNRKSAHYSYALELARLIILNYSPDIKSGKEKMLSLLFDMNVLWEDYVLVKLRDWNDKNELGYTIHGQDSTTFIGSHTLRPDIVLEKDNQTIVIDTKWKRPGNSASVQDLRQMYTYCRFWNAKKAMLLYPGEKMKSTAFRTFAADDYHSINEKEIVSVDHQCRLGFVSVLGNDGVGLSDFIGKDVFELVLENSKQNTIKKV